MARVPCRATVGDVSQDRTCFLAPGGGGGVAGGDPRIEMRQSDVPGGDPAPQGGAFADRDMTKVHAPDFGRSHSAGIESSRCATMWPELLEPMTRGLVGSWRRRRRGATLAKLNASGAFPSLDAKLASALPAGGPATQILSGDIFTLSAKICTELCHTFFDAGQFANFGRSSLDVGQF